MFLSLYQFAVGDNLDYIIPIEDNPYLSWLQSHTVYTAVIEGGDFKVPAVTPAAVTFSYVSQHCFFKRRACTHPHVSSYLKAFFRLPSLHFPSLCVRTTLTPSVCFSRNHRYSAFVFKRL